MDRTVKGTIAVILAALIVFVAVLGSYLPLRKSQMFIGVLNNLAVQPPTSIQDLETRAAAPLDYYAPIGQEELVRNTANNVLGFIQHGTDATTTRDLVSFLNGYYDPILNSGKGMSFGQDLYLEGAVNELAFVQTGDPTYLQAAIKYYSEGHALGPNRPQPLYGLFDVFRAMGDIKDAQAVGEAILANWPSDTRVVASLEQLLAPTSSAKSAKAKTK